MTQSHPVYGPRWVAFVRLEDHMRPERWWLLSYLLAALTVTFALASPPPAVPSAGRTTPMAAGVTQQVTYFNYIDATRLAAGDLAILKQTVDPDLLYFIRYVSIHNTPKAKRLARYHSISYLLNSYIGGSLAKNKELCKKFGVVAKALKARPSIVRPLLFGPDGGIVIRVNLLDYRIDPAVWDELARTNPYFLQTIQKQEVITEQKDAGYKKVPTVEVTKPVPFKAGASWGDPEALMFLNANLHTVTPIVRGDWWIRYSSVEPFYSKLIGFATIEEWKQLAAFDERAEALKEVKATVVKSGSDGLCARVATNNRILARIPTFQGIIWETYDFATSVGPDNVISNIPFFLDDKKASKQRVAAEFIGSNAVGLHFFAITDKQDKLIAAGDTAVVVDTLAKDATVRNGRSCFWCHPTGINPFKSQFQKQIGERLDQADLGVYAKTGLQAELLRQSLRDVFGLPTWDDYIAGDNANYAKAVKACNGLDPTENARFFKEAWEEYEDDDVTPEVVSYEIGMPEADWRALLALRINGRNNGVLLQALLQPAIGIRRDQWEENFVELGLLSTLKNRLPPPVPMMPLRSGAGTVNRSKPRRNSARTRTSGTGITIAARTA